jgi:hypothetical protein
MGRESLQGGGSGWSLRPCVVSLAALTLVATQMVPILEPIGQCLDLRDGFNVMRALQASRTIWDPFSFAVEADCKPGTIFGYLNTFSFCIHIPRIVRLTGVGTLT